mgnify:CR=1 FL=1
MLNKSLFFSRIPKYLYHKDKTPYFTNPNKMSLVQSQYELFSYGVLIGTIFSFIGLAAILSIKNYFELEFVFWITFSLATIISIHLTIKKRRKNVTKMLQNVTALYDLGLGIVVGELE